jgi:hypothetical protein
MHEPAGLLIQQMKFAVAIADEGRTRDFALATFILARLIEINELPEGEFLEPYLHLLSYAIKQDMKPAMCEDMLLDVQLYQGMLGLGPMSGEAT